ncbi:MAG: glutamine-hydrolyzing GMP synthase [Actinobacteria bacterium]|nr:glutamine-hydrolyzing GMP synthase [Actinomycetota bacterium]
MENIIVLDFGGQYSQLIARRVRELRVYSELLPFNTSLDAIKEKNPSGIIFSGSPGSISAKNYTYQNNKQDYSIEYKNKAPEVPAGIFELGIPVLGICYGMQLITHLLGGEVSGSGSNEFGKTEMDLLAESPLFKGLKQTEVCWMSHRDSVVKIPYGFKVIASTPTLPVAGIGNNDKKIYGIQFHPEVIHTPSGMEILKNFLFDICGCTPSWTMVSIIENQAASIKNTVRGRNVICALSGGVDSTVSALLVNKAVGRKLTCIFVDHGLLRYGEDQQVEKTFRENFKINFIHIKAKERFLSKLKDVTDPEEKRKIIGNEFIRVFEEEARKIKNVEYLVQGTLYSDVIESGTGVAAKIKSHHNVGGLPADMNIKLIEPLRLLFKDEVRKLGIELGLSEEIVRRQPFPGPGLAIRIIGEVTHERLEILKMADRIVLEEIKRADLYQKIWQSFAVLPAIKSVGVMGDERTYAYPIVIRAVNSEDAMTADWVRLPYEVMERMSSRIINEVDGVNRVVYDISSKPPSTIEWE